MNKEVFQIVVVLIAGILSLGACAQQGEKKGVESPNLRGSDCILIRTIRDYTPLDDRHLLIWGPGKRGYFVTLFRPAFGMRSAITLRFSSRDDRLCPYGGDSIVIGGMGDDNVPVQSIRRVSKDQAEELKIRYGKHKPADSKAPEAADVEGAEVEELD